MSGPKVIAEIANAHEGRMETILKMISVASESQADYIKFQLYRAKELVAKDHPKYDNYHIKEFSESEWMEIADHSRKCGIQMVGEIFDYPSFLIGQKMGLSGYKVHSTTISDLVLLREVARDGKPVYLSCGGSSKEELHKALKVIREEGNQQIILMHGFQNFPTELANTHLDKIDSLRTEFNLPVGVQDHIAGDDIMAFMVPVMAMMKGVVVIEKHFTLDRSLKETDYFSSLNPDEFKSFVSIVRRAPNASGSSSFDLSEEELAYRNLLKKSLYTKHKVPKGQSFTLDDISFKRSLEDDRILVDRLYEVIGKTAKDDIEENIRITLALLNS